MQCGPAQEPCKVRYSGINVTGRKSYPAYLYVKFTITIETTHLWVSNYSPYQKELFDKIVRFRDDILTPKSFVDIAKILNTEGLKTPNGHPFHQKHVFSIYKKGKIREERVNRPDIVDVSIPTVEVFKTFKELYNRVMEDPDNQ